MIEHKLKEAEIDRDNQILENTNIKENFVQKEKALNDEIQSLKEREDQLKKTNSLLEKKLEEQKRANLDTVAGSNRIEDGSKE